MTISRLRGFRWSFFLLGLTGCAVFGPPSPKSAVQAPVADPGPASYTPDSWSLTVDRHGLSPLALTESGTVPEDWAELMPDDVAEPIDPWAPHESVEPLLAVTGTVTFDIPMSDDERVQMWVDFLQGRGRKSFSRWLSRSTRYGTLFLPILEEYGLPRDIVFLSMIESGFSPRAYSWAHAAGPWQFMPATGRRYGLRIGFWVDERLDFIKSTHAAATYLSNLYNKFGHWFLAFAAYNAGPGKVSRAIRWTGTDDFWRISRTRRLRRETKHYVPKLLAAAQITKQPERFGFADVQYLPPFRWETVEVDIATHLETIAGACGLKGTEPLELLNPELRCKITPPGERYTVRVPEGAAETCTAGLAALPPSERYTFRYYVPSERDDIEKIARLHTTTATAIAAFNEVKDGRLRPYDELAVPVKVTDADDIPIVKPGYRRFRHAVYGPSDSRVIVHRVRSGDSLWRIARRYRVSVRKLRLWNGLWRTNTLRIGQRIRVYGGRRAPGRRSYGRSAQRDARRHRVRAGESLWSIAVRHGTSVDRLCRLNGIDRNDKLQIGRVLKVR